MKSLLSLQTFIKQSSIKDDIRFAHHEMECLKCCFNVKDSQEGIAFFKFSRHLASCKHRTNCGWFIERKDGDDSFVLHQDPKNKTLKQFYDLNSAHLQPDVDDICTDPSVIPIELPSSSGINTASEDWFESGSDLSPDPFLVAIDDGTFTIENAVNPPEMEYKFDVSVQTECNSIEVDDIVKKYLKDELNLKINDNFDIQDLQNLFASKPLIKLIIEDNLNRKNVHSSHDPLIKEYIVKHALMYSHASALSISKSIGGPLKSTIKAACLVDVKILPYINEKNLNQHLEVFTKTLKKSYIENKDCSIQDLREIPVQVSIDATPTTGKMSTRKMDGCQKGIRMLYGVRTGTHQRPVISLEKLPDKPVFCVSKSRDVKQFLFINGLESVPQLLKEKKIHRVFSHITVVALPLVHNAKPYCLAIVSQGKGFTSEALKSVHISVCGSFQKGGLKLVTIPGKLGTVDYIDTTTIIVKYYFTSQVLF